MLELITLTLIKQDGQICLAMQCHETGKRFAVSTEQDHENQIRTLVRHAHIMRNYGFKFAAIESCLMRLMRRTTQASAA